LNGITVPVLTAIASLILSLSASVAYVSSEMATIKAEVRAAHSELDARRDALALIPRLDERMKHVQQDIKGIRKAMGLDAD
jgi:outer membrane murein-binding lipoprotein Lpp